MEPLFYVVKLLALAYMGGMPTPPTTVPAEVQVQYVANATVISEDTVVVEKKQEEEKKEAEAAEQTPVEESPTVKESLQLPLPAKSYAFTSNYGSRCPPARGASSFHRGIDLAAPDGTPLYAIQAGTITKVVDGVKGGTGGTVILATTINGERVDFFYHHMGNSSQYVKAGDVVTAGQQISGVGSTGVSTGPHLHIEVWEGGYGEGESTNPELYFKKIQLPVIENAYAVTVGPEATSCPAPVQAPAPLQFPTTVPPKAAAPAPSAAPAAPAPSPSAAPAPSKPAPAPSPAPSPAPTAPAPAPAPSPAPTTPPKPVTPVPTTPPAPVVPVIPVVPSPVPSSAPAPAASAVPVG